MQTILATFDDKQAAQAAVDQLIASGFTRSNVHLEARDGVSGGIRQGATGSDATRNRDDSTGQDDGFLARVGHFFSNLFESDDDGHAGNYAEAVRRGSTVVAVDASTDDEVAKAERLMRSMGSIDIDQRAESWRSRGWKGFDPNAPLADDDLAFQRDSVPVVQEELAVGKREVNVGSLRVVKRRSEMPVSEIVKLREEHATVSRKPVNRPATDADFESFKEGTVEVRETAEEPVVSKKARVVEEVSVGKEVTEREQKVSDTVRRTEVEVQREPGSRPVADASAAGTQRTGTTVRTGSRSSDASLEDSSLADTGLADDRGRNALSPDRTSTGMTGADPSIASRSIEEEDDDLLGDDDTGGSVRGTTRRP